MLLIELARALVPWKADPWRRPWYRALERCRLIGTIERIYTMRAFFPKHIADRLSPNLSSHYGRSAKPFLPIQPSVPVDIDGCMYQSEACLDG